jgi:hypothetical protein
MNCCATHTCVWVHDQMCEHVPHIIAAKEPCDLSPVPAQISVYPEAEGAVLVSTCVKVIHNTLTWLQLLNAYTPVCV